MTGRSYPPLRLPVKLAYACSAPPNSVKSRALSTFLLLFYNQVMGLPAQTVATVMMIALIVDAIVDPLVGQISDNFRSAWGRRHPFMYAAALPFPIAFYFLWNPPDVLNEAQLFGYMLGALLTIRVLDTFFELPSMALLPELTRDYDERTQVVALRNLTGVVCGALFVIAAYQVFLKENPDGSGGVLAEDGYQLFGLAGALILFVFIMISTLGTHHRIRYLSAPPNRRITFGGMAREILATVNNRSFIVLTVVGMFSYIALGVKGAIDVYFHLFFWGFSQTQLSLIAGMAVAATFAGAAASPYLAKRVGKKYGLMITFALYGIIGPAPVLLRLLGWMPPNGTDLLFAIMLADMTVTTVLSVMAGIMLTAMIFDIVEDSEVKTGRRSEGLLTAADSLFKKIVSGVGVFVSGMMLTIAEFPRGAERGEVPAETLRTLGLLYVPTLAVIYSMVIVCLFFYRIDKRTHEANLRRLQAAPAE